MRVSERRSVHRGVSMSQRILRPILQIFGGLTRGLEACGCASPGTLKSRVVRVTFYCYLAMRAGVWR